MRAALLLPLLLLPSCGDGPVPTAVPARVSPAALAVPAGQGDVDGDGTVDEIAYDAGEVVVTLSGSGRLVRSSTDADIDADDPVTAGVEDLDRDGRAELFVQVGRGASTAFLLPLRFDGSELAPLRVGDRPLLLGIGGSATHGDGFSCTEAGTLIVRSAQSEDGETFALTATTYRVDGFGLVQTGRTTATATSIQAPSVAAAYAVDCRTVGKTG